MHTRPGPESRCWCSNVANHIRRQIREAAAALVTGLTTTGARVYQSRVYPLQPAVNLPGLLVYTTEESADLDSLTPPRGSMRKLSLVIEGVARATADLDDTLDAIAKEVEIALAAAPTLSGLTKDNYLSTTEIALNGEGDIPTGSVKLTWTIEYRVRETAPDVAI